MDCCCNVYIQMGLSADLALQMSHLNSFFFMCYYNMSIQMAALYKISISNYTLFFDQSWHCICCIWMPSFLHELNFMNQGEFSTTNITFYCIFPFMNCWNISFQIELAKLYYKYHICLHFCPSWTIEIMNCWNISFQNEVAKLLQI